MKKTIIFFICVFTIIGIIFYLPKNKEAHIDSDFNTKAKIGVLSSSESGLSKVQGLIEGLKEYGYYKENLEIEVKNADGDRSKLKILARELVEEGHDLIISTGPFETKALKDTNTEIPVIFLGVGCSVELGLIENEILPGGNITGVDSHYVQLSGKRLEYFKKVVPDLENVAVLYNPDVTPLMESEKVIKSAGDKLGVNVKMVSVYTKDDIIYELEYIEHDNTGVMLMCNFLTDNAVDSIIENCNKYDMPLMGLTDLHVERGALAFYGSTDFGEGYQGSRIVASVLKGQSPGIIPIESPEKLEFHLNLKNLDQLGIQYDESNITFVDKFVNK